MIRDRDRIYGGIVTRRLRAMGIRDKPIAPALPWQNGFAERLIGSSGSRRAFGEAHLLQILRFYARYYNDVSFPIGELIVFSTPIVFVFLEKQMHDDLRVGCVYRKA
jgi:hypothetical protein